MMLCVFLLTLHFNIWVASARYPVTTSRSHLALAIQGTVVSNIYIDMDRCTHHALIPIHIDIDIDRERERMYTINTTIHASNIDKE